MKHIMPNYPSKQTSTPMPTPRKLGISKWKSHRHLNVNLSTNSPFSLSAELEKWNRSIPPLLLPSSLLEGSKSYKIYLGNSSFHLLSTQQEVFLQELIIIRSPNKFPLRFQSQSFPHPFSNYKDLLRKANLLFFRPYSNP